MILVSVGDQDVTDGSGSRIDESPDVPLIRWAGIDDRPLIAGAHEIAVGPGTGHGAGVGRGDAADAVGEANGNTGLNAGVGRRIAPVVLGRAHPTMLARAPSEYAESEPGRERRAELLTTREILLFYLLRTQDFLGGLGVSANDDRRRNVP